VVGPEVGEVVGAFDGELLSGLSLGLLLGDLDGGQIQYCSVPHGLTPLQLTVAVPVDPNGA